MGTAAAIALMLQLAPGLLQAGVPLEQGLQQHLLLQQQVQIAYYQATTAYWNAQARASRRSPGRCRCRK